MKIIKSVLPRLLIYGSMLFAYWQLIDNDYLQNTFFNQVPEPTKFSRPPDVYEADWKKSDKEDKEFMQWFASAGGVIWAGFAKRDITPSRFFWIAGFGVNRPALIINDPLWVKSLALRDIWEHKVVIVSCDLIGLLPDEIQKIKSMVKGVDPDRVFIGTTHTHSGPDTIGLWGLWIKEGVLPVTTGKNKRYQEFLRNQIAEAINESVRNLKEPVPGMSAIRFSSGRLSSYSHGRDENSPDFNFSVMQVSVNWKQPVTLVNFACHPDVLQAFYVSSDFVYFLEQKLQRLVGGEVMFLPRAIGGVEPLKDETGWRSAYFARTLGENLADEVWRSLKKPIAPKGLVPIKVRRQIVLASLENKNFQEAAKFGLISDLTNDGMISAEVNRISIGPAEILTVPGELFPKIWWHVEPLMKGEPKFIFGLTNGEYGYIMLPEDINSGKHKYHKSMSVGPTFGIEIEKALKKILTEQ